MFKMHDDLEISFLRKLFIYNADSGVLTRRVSRGPKRAGSVVGSPRADGYLSVMICDKNYQLHRIIYAMETGAWPTGLIDHRDLSRSNNRIGNLRDATPSQNLMNTSIRSDNKTGYRGVSIGENGRFIATIHHNRKKTHLGCFSSAAEASATYQRAAAEMFGEFAS